MSNPLVQISGLVNQLQKPVPSIPAPGAVIGGAAAVGDTLIDTLIPPAPPPIKNSIGSIDSPAPHLDYLC
jgi:hypothetical protein